MNPDLVEGRRSGPSAPRRAEMRILLLIAALALPWCGPTAAAAQVARVHPVDEAVQRPGFFSFRARLLQAVQGRDTVVLYSVLAPDILNSFGGDGGIAEFKEMWRPGDPDSRIWTELTGILSLGGAFVAEDLFVAPYTSSSFPDGWDSFDYVAVVGADVRVRERPTTSAPVLMTLSFDIVRRAAEPAGSAVDGWTAVQLADGRTGYVAAAYARSPVDRRAGFVHRDGRWLLRTFVAGD
jgi:hypothetical protein